MIKKQYIRAAIIILLLFIYCFSSYAQKPVDAAIAEDALVIPEGVRYKKASDKTNDEAKQILNKLFSHEATDQDVLSLVENKALVCGPGLWRDIKGDSAMSKIETGIVSFEVPVLDGAGKITRIDKYEGKLFQSADEVLLFWKAFSNKNDLTGFRIRKLNPVELKIFWAMIPFDITEPLFILESKEHKLLTVFESPDKLKVSWIDDYQHLSTEK